MFGLGSPFKRKSHYVYNYTPRYYDEKKERLEKLKEKYKDFNPDEQNEEVDDDITITFSKNNLKSAWKKTRKSNDDYKSTRRLALIITILIGIVAYIFELHKLI